MFPLSLASHSQLILLYPPTPPPYPILALHRGLGHAVYAMALTSCATGLQSRQSSNVGLGLEPPYSPQARLNAGMSVVLFSLGISTYAALTFLPVKRKG